MSVIGRLFWKFFIAFWLALLVAGVGVGVVVWLHRPASSTDSAIVGGGAPALVTRAGASVLAGGGLPALRDMLGEMRRGDDPFPLYVVDAHGDELLGRAVSAAAIAEAEQAAAGDDPRRAARRVTLFDGGAFLLFVPAAAASPPSGAPPSPKRPPPPAPWLPIIAGVLASLLFSAASAWYLAKPVRLLRRAFDAAAGGDLGMRVQPLMGGRRDEIADLGRDFDHMADRLQDLLGAQQRLLHDVSHELRSPLARLQAAAGLVRQYPADLGLALERIERETGRLDALVGELLTLARLESGVPGAMEEAVDVHGLVEELVADARFEASTFDCRVKFGGAGRAVVRGRAELLARAIGNVLRNAVKYAGAGGVVSVDVESDEAGRRACVTVTDSGPGVAPADLPFVFEPFFRGECAGGGGYGLGMAIARRAVAAHGGTIWVENVSSGGLRVVIALPLAAAAG